MSKPGSHNDCKLNSMCSCDLCCANRHIAELERLFAEAEALLAKDRAEITDWMAIAKRESERVSEVTRDRDLEKRMRKDADEYRERVLEENTRLRKALERIAKADDHGKSCLSDSTKAQIMDWAREALQSRQASQASGTPEVAAGGNGPGQVTPGSGSNPHEVRQDQLGSSPSPAASTPVQGARFVCVDCGNRYLDVGALDQHRALSHDAAQASSAKGDEKMIDVKKMVDRFLAWPLPKSVRPDACVMDPDYPHAMSGTNLLTASEAEEMFRYVLDEATGEEA